MTFINLAVREILHSFRLVIERKTCSELSDSLRLEFSGKISANLALSNGEDKTFEPLKRGGININFLLLGINLHSLQTLPAI